MSGRRLVIFLTIVFIPVWATEDGMYAETGGFNWYLFGETLQRKLAVNGRYRPDHPLLRTEPYLFKTTKDIAKAHGYPFEAYDVRTEDGYILDIHRIRCGRSTCPSQRRYPVLLVSGLGGSSVNFVCDPPDISLGFVLADNGYDVWLLNARGNSYSRKHLTYSISDKKFWDFGWDEIAIFDVPATIDFIIHKTGSPQVHYIGISLGSTIAYATFAARPEYNEKIRAHVALAPTVFMEHTRTAARVLSQFYRELETLADMFQVYEFGSREQLDFVTDLFCFLPNTPCENILVQGAGYNVGKVNSTRIPVYFSQFPEGSSTRAYLHVLQLIFTGKFRKYDFGSRINLKRYGTIVPPAYNLSHVTAPTLLLFGENDGFIHPNDIRALAAATPGTRVLHRMENELFGHVDFILSFDAKPLFHPILLDFLGRT